MRIRVPERGIAKIPDEAWRILANDARFWRLVENKIIEIGAAGSGAWKLRGTCYVGRALLGPHSLEAVEKFPGAFSALINAGVLDSPKLVAIPSPVTPEEGSTAILVSIFIRAVRRYLSGFKERKYTTVPDQGAMVGGRLDVLRTARLRAHGTFHKVAFNRTVMTADLSVNRCIYAALREVERLAHVARIATADRMAARALRASLSECLVGVLSLRRSEIAELAAQEVMNAKTAEAADAISLAGAVLDAAGFGGSGEWSRTVERSWFVNLETLFERAIRKTVALAMGPEFAVSGPINRPPLFKPDAGRYHANPDLVVRKAGHVVAIGDAKYKDFSSWPGASDVHEILAHAAAFGTQKALMFYPAEGGYAARAFGKSATGIDLWAFGVPLDDMFASIRLALTECRLVSAQVSVD
jgi:McrBC 5-methylcytosine restriction system component